MDERHATEEGRQRGPVYAMAYARLQISLAVQRDVSTLQSSRIIEAHPSSPHPSTIGGDN